MTTAPGDTLPRRIGRYEVVAPLAAGGMAEVLLGRLVGPSGFERVVVLKRMLPHLARDRRFVAMFLDEARIAARIHHPNVVTVFELGEVEGELFLAMEYVEGESFGSLMRALCVNHETLPPALVAYLLAESCAGLHAAHELTDADGHPLDVVHRDVSPQNVIVTYAGSVKVLDFGIARAGDRLVQTEAGQVKGKFGYMSPEQCRGKMLDRRSDVFALGTLLYELSTGRRLFKRASDMQTLEAICEGPVVPPSQLVPGYPAELERVCLQALAKAREQRYRTAADMRRDLLRALRKLDGENDPAELTAGAMRRLFGRRIEEKREMLRRVSAGSAPATLPPAELHGEVEIPTLPMEMVEETRATMQTEAKSASSRRDFRYLAAGALLAAIGIASFALRPSADIGVPVAAETAGEAPRPEPPSPPPAEPAASASTAPIDEVLWRIETRPPGARVYLAGADRGLTPIDLRVARGAQALELRIVRDGYAPIVRQLVPSRDERLELALAERPPARPVPKVRPSAAPDDDLEFHSVDQGVDSRPR